MSEEELTTVEKKQFAALWITERDPFKAAIKLCPDNTNRALWISAKWVNDEIVLDEKQTLEDSDYALKCLPDKAAFAKQILDKMEKTHDPDAYAKLGKLYADIMGFVEKKQSLKIDKPNIPNVIELVSPEYDDSV